MKKTLGGERLGSGKKMKVELHGYQRSTHDLGYIWRSSMAAGTLVPFLCEVALPGDTFDIDLAADIKTHPTIGPLFATEKLQLDVFQAPIRLYNAELHNNSLGVGMNMSQVKFPTLNVAVPQFINREADIDNSQVNPSCIMSYLGIRGYGRNAEVDDVERKFNGIPFLAYWEIYKNYYANKMEDVGAVLHTPTVALVETVTGINKVNYSGGAPVTEAIGNGGGAYTPVSLNQYNQIVVDYTGAQPIAEQILFMTTEWGLLTLKDLLQSVNVSTGGSTNLNGYYNYSKWGTSITVQYWRYLETEDVRTDKPAIKTFPLENIDEMRRKILQAAGTPGNFDIVGTTLEPYIWPTGKSGGRFNSLSSQEGLALKTYQSDLFNNWLNTEWIDGASGITEITKVDVVDGYLKLDALNLAQKVYNLLNRIAVSGGTYDDWLDVTYDHDRYQRCESPMYCGGMIQEIVFQEVVSNSGSIDQPLGTQAGRGRLDGKKKGGHITIKVDEPSYIIGLVSITPRLDYSQGNKWDTHLMNMDELHKPALDEIGFQDLITEQLAWWDTAWDGTKWLQKSAGKQPAWINYMTNVNQTRGNFAIQDNEMFMTMNRRYEYDGSSFQLADLTTYIDPSKFNNIFAETSLDAQNYWAQIAVDITARRKMSAKIMPNL